MLRLREMALVNIHMIGFTPQMNSNVMQCIDLIECVCVCVGGGGGHKSHDFDFLDKFEILHNLNSP